MKKRLKKTNINTVKYLDRVYSKNGWINDVGDAIKRDRMIVDKLSHHHEVLDIGCAAGYFLKAYLNKYDSLLVGIDISPIVIRQAREYCPDASFIVGNCYHLPFKDESFDLVHMGQIIEHLEEPDKAIKEALRVLRKGGELIVTTPNEKAADDPEHLWMWDIQAIIEMLKGTTIIEMDNGFYNGVIIYIRVSK